MSLPQLGPIKFLTIHCTATPEGRDVPAQDVNTWDIVKFGQRSYHYIVLLDGTVVENLSVQYKGAHVGMHNTGNVGVAYVGGMDPHLNKAKDTRTPQQTAALLKLVKEFKAKYPDITVRGHRDWPDVHKDCPSFNVHDWLLKEGVH